MANDFPKLPRIISITLEILKNETNESINRVYKRASKTLTTASPFGQILQVVRALQAQMYKYIENLLSESSILRASNESSIRGHAVSAGYIPTRSIAAAGMLKLTVNTGIDIQEEIPGSQIIIPNNTRIINMTSRLNYTIKTTGNQVNYEIKPDTIVYLNVIQGKMQRQTRTSDGSSLQTFQIQTRGSDIDNFEVTVIVNGVKWDTRKTLRDILPNEQAVVVRTGLDGISLDIIFGNGDMGAIPARGSKIDVEYLITDGAAGIVNFDKPNDWQFVDDIYDAFGDSIDVTRVFNIGTEIPVKYGADADSIEFIRAIVPYVSRNEVLALPEHFVYALKRLGQFAYVDAFAKLDDDNPDNDRTVFLYLIPNLRLYSAGGIGYFDIPESRFIYSDEDKQRILTYMTKMGTIYMGTEVEILDLKLSRYVIFTFIRLFEDADEQMVREEIISKISDYFLNFNRRDRVPGSDLIKEIDNIDGVDSVNIRFISEKNEVYHRNAIQYVDKVRRENPSIATSDIVVPNYDPNTTLGLNREIEEIIIDREEIPIIRGGWKDRNGLEFTPTPEDGKLGPVNISFDSVRSRRKLI